MDPPTASYFRFQLLKHVVGPRAKFVPSVPHPTEVASYTSTYDSKACEAWLNLVGLTAGSEPRGKSLLLRSRIMVGDGESGLVYMQDAAPNSLVASVKEIAPLLKTHSPPCTPIYSRP